MPGRVRFWRGGRGALAVALLTGLLPVASPVGDVDAAATQTSAFRPLGPTRLADTRPEEGASGFSRHAPDLIRVQVAGRAGVPADAVAAVLNIASVGAAGRGFVTAYPAGASRPLTSSLNIAEPGGIVANMTTVRLGAGGAVDVYTNVPMQLVVDLTGAYVPAGGSVAAGRLVTLAGGARRIFDTRERGVETAPRFTEFIALATDLVPATATAAVVNIAAVAAQPGYWTAFAGGTRPLASTLNVDQPGQTRNAQAIVPLTAGAGGLSLFSQSGGHVVVDLVGYFTGAAPTGSREGLFVPADPSRLLDTRYDHAIAPWGGTVVEFDSGARAVGLGGNVAAVAMNLAVTEPLDLGFITAYPAGVARPGTANLNITRLGDLISNHAIVRVGARGLSLFTQSGAQMIADVAGWYLGTPEPSVLPPPVNPVHGPTSGVSVSSPMAGLSAPIMSGNVFSVIEFGAAGLWGGSGQLGVPAQNIYFAHRSSKGGPFRNLNRMPVGSMFSIVGADGSTFVYRVVHTAIISPRPSELAKMAQSFGPVAVTLVACHPPGSTGARIVVVGALIGAW